MPPLSKTFHSGVCHILPLVRGLPTRIHRHLSFQRRSSRPSLPGYPYRSFLRFHCVRSIPPVLPRPEMGERREHRARRVSTPGTLCRVPNSHLIVNFWLDCEEGCPLDRSHHRRNIVHARYLATLPERLPLPSHVIPQLHCKHLCRE